ncbi:hypothetical protein RB608_11810 [Nocardioides sp. LHD-245]|uniref:hypothetical protein n=1 Tax=Nocardioides sp. LHD-245 TaxID=3051387 RepID=UPI0027E1653A|nr:hypothetical protein [Nocardioides sp. LHD-245]
MSTARKVLRRTNTETSAVFEDGNVASIKLQRQRIAWTCTDNLGMTRAEASAAAELWDGKSSLQLGQYRFELVEVQP